MDIHLNLTFPSISSGINFSGLAESILTARPDFQFARTDSISFRFNCDITFLRCGAFPWIPTVSFSPIPIVPFHSVEDHTQNGGFTFQYFHQNGSSKENPVNQELQEQQISPNHDPITENLPQWVQDAILSIQKGNTKLCASGVGGTYFVHDSEITAVNEPQSMSSVFKPVDEEPGAPNNPKNNPPSFIPMMPWGAGANREVAAFKIDKDLVPETHFVEVTNHEGVKKIGSLQKYIQNDGDCSDVGANKFSVEDVHRIGIFDIRILNMDRNDENLLIRKHSEKEWKLIPIDHTYAFPNEVNSYFNWQFWNQTKKPFSPENLTYISSINPVSDALALLDTGIDEESIRNVIGSTLLLQNAAIKGFNLFQISSMVSGKENDLVKILSIVREREEFHQIINKTVVEERLRSFKNLVNEIIEEFLSCKKC